MAKILIIEDDKFLRKVIVKKLELKQFEVIETLKGEDGLAEIKKQKPDLILLDLILPGIDGFKVLTELKKKSETANIPVIILSNLGQKEDIKRGLELGADDYLIKAHFTPDEIIEKINKILNLEN